jgi:general secretion pathway protein A
MRHPDVAWLRERLERATGQTLAAALSDRYDGQLASAVESLQRAHGLEPDGIAGARTLITLNNLLPDPATPRLTDAAVASHETSDVVHP